MPVGVRLGLAFSWIVTRFEVVNRSSRPPRLALTLLVAAAMLLTGQAALPVKYTATGTPSQTSPA